MQVHCHLGVCPKFHSAQLPAARIPLVHCVDAGMALARRKGGELEGIQTSLLLMLIQQDTVLSDNLNACSSSLPAECSSPCSRRTKSMASCAGKCRHAAPIHWGFLNVYSGAGWNIQHRENHLYPFYCNLWIGAEDRGDPACHQAPRPTHLRCCGNPRRYSLHWVCNYLAAPQAARICHR